MMAQFGAVFAAAFLAFVFENVRERRRTARWVKEHLGHLRELLAPNVHRARVTSDRASQLDALDTWLAAEDPTELSEQAWAAAAAWTQTDVPDLGAVLRSEAVDVVPQDLALALVKLETVNSEIVGATQRAEEARRDVMPAWHERRVPLNEGDASRVRRLRSTAAQLEALVPEMLDALGDAVAAIDRWR